MAPRIEKAEVISFRLEVPLDALERLPDEVGALPLTVETRGESHIQVTAGGCRLGFLPVGSVARLSDVTLAEDERGLFFQRVLGPLVVRYRGDLHVRLGWNVPERNSHGDHAEVRILQGITTYPGLSTLKNMLIASRDAQPPLFPPSQAPRAADPVQTGPQGPSAEELEVEQLLEEGRRHFEEYLRLKNRSHSQTT